MTGYGSKPQELDNQLKVTCNLSRFPLPPAARDRRDNHCRRTQNPRETIIRQCLKRTVQHNQTAFVREGNKVIQLKRPEQSFYDSAIDYKTEFRISAHR